MQDTDLIQNASDTAFWLTFCFAGHDPNDLHCTHKYLGELTPRQQTDLLQILRDWFSAREFRPFRVLFDQVEMFGADKDVRVLTAEKASAFSRFDSLRKRLEVFRKDDFKFTPHVSTEKLGTVYSAIDRYALMQGKTVRHLWRAETLSNSNESYVTLRPIFESTADYEAIEKRIKAVFRELLYKPLLSAMRLSAASVQNAPKSALTAAIESGKVYIETGRPYKARIETGRPYKARIEYISFKGEFDAAISKELRALGAKWNANESSWRLLPERMTPELHAELQAATQKSMQTFLKAADTLRQNLPEEIAASVKVTDFFDSVLLKVDTAFKGSLKDLVITPKLTDTQRRRIAEEWQENMERWIKDFADEEVETLRENIKKSAFKGNRYESSVATIKRSFGVTERKAKFLARQETGLLMAKFKESRYTEAGIHEYTWRCVAGSAAHPVRPSHKVLDGKVFRFDTPPITTPPGEPARRNNPGEDYNCRCHAVPRVKVRKTA